MRRWIKLFPPLLIFFFGVLSAMAAYPIALLHSNDQHFLLLAEQFLKGMLYLSPFNLPPGDYVDLLGRQYLYFGPTPSILLMPIVYLFKFKISQGVIGLVCIPIAYILIVHISQKFKYSENDSLWLSNFFIFSSPILFVGLVNISAYQIQVLGLVFVLLAIYEFFHRKRWLLVGLFIALAGFTRLSLYLTSIFFLLEFLKNKIDFKEIIPFILPIVISILLLSGYNFKRFHSFIETGYKMNVTLNYFPMNANLKFGFFSPNHLPANLYTLFLKGPNPIEHKFGWFILDFPYLKVDPWGLSILITSPLLLFLFTRFKTNSFSRSALITSVILALPSLTYAGIGFSQFGYRYALDFLPFIFLALPPCLGNPISKSAKILIAVGVIFCSLYMTSLWGVYPLFNIY